jgi:hypothetical protein
MGVVHVFLETRAGREFLCQAVNVERLGLDRSNLAILARPERGQARPARAGEGSIHAITEDADSDSILHETPALAAASIAVESSDIAALAAPPAPHDVDIIAEGERALHKMDTLMRPPRSESEEWAAEWDRYRALRTCTDISEADRAWMVRYEASPEFRAYRRLEERAA